jgi:hypothetical protein
MSCLWKIDGKFGFVVGSVVGGSVVLGCFVGLGLFLGFLGWKILLYLVGFCVFGIVEGV